jgi:hypothetical protein
MILQNYSKLSITNNSSNLKRERRYLNLVVLVARAGYAKLSKEKAQMKKPYHSLCIRMPRTFLTVLILILGMLANWTFAASSEQDRISNLEERIARLEERVQRLEKLLGAMSERQEPVLKRESSPNLGDWRVRGNWSRIKDGMSFEQVTQILGRPTRTDMAGQDHGTWYYEGYVDRAGAVVSGNIFFLNRKVLRVNPPVY